jgi:hypothetical protein
MLGVIETPPTLLFGWVGDLLQLPAASAHKATRVAREDDRTRMPITVTYE